MAIVLVVPMETGDTLGMQGSTGTFSFVTSPVHSGGFSLLSNPTGAAGRINPYTGLSAAGVQQDGGLTTIKAGFWLRTGAAAPSANSPIFSVLNSANTVLAQIVEKTDGALLLRYTNGSDVLTDIGSSAVLAANSEFWVELAAVSVASAGSSTVEMRINGIVIQTASSLTILSGSRTIDRCRIGYSNTITGSINLDDLIADNANYPGPCWTQVLKPTSVVTNTFTSGTFTDVDEMDGTAVNDGDTTYLGDATSGHVATFGFSNLSGFVGTIKAVVLNYVVRDEGGVSSIKGRLISGATTDDMTAMDPGATYVLRQKIYVTDPNTGAAWTRAAVDALVAGVVNSASVAVRVTAIALWVVYDQSISRRTLHHTGTRAGSRAA